MRAVTLLDCETGLTYGPYRTCAMAQAEVEAHAIVTWEIFTDGDKLIDCSPHERTVRQGASSEDCITPAKNVPKAAIE